MGGYQQKVKKIQARRISVVFLPLRPECIAVACGVFNIAARAAHRLVDDVEGLLQEERQSWLGTNNVDKSMKERDGGEAGGDDYGKSCCAPHTRAAEAQRRPHARVAGVTITGAAGGDSGVSSKAKTS